MTKDQLEILSFTVAAGSYLTEVLTPQEYEAASDEDIKGLLWEPIENFDVDEVYSLIDSLAYTIKVAFEDCVNE